MDNIKKNIGQSINTLLAQQDKRQKDLACALGVTNNTISYFCTGTRSPNYSQLIKIADFFNVRIDTLFNRGISESEADTVVGICNYTGLSIQAVKNIKGLEGTALSSVIGSEHFLDLIFAFQDFNDHATTLSYLANEIEQGREVSDNLKTLRMLLYIAKYEKYAFIEYCNGILNEMCRFDEEIQAATAFLDKYEASCLNMNKESPEYEEALKKAETAIREREAGENG